MKWDRHVRSERVLKKMSRCMSIAGRKENEQLRSTLRLRQQRKGRNSLIQTLWNWEISSVFPTSVKKVECEAIFESINVIMAQKSQPLPIKRNIINEMKANRSKNIFSAITFSAFLMRSLSLFYISPPTPIVTGEKAVRLERTQLQADLSTSFVVGLQFTEGWKSPTLKHFIVRFCLLIDWWLDQDPIS